MVYGARSLGVTMTCEEERIQMEIEDALNNIEDEYGIVIDYSWSYYHDSEEED